MPRYLFRMEDLAPLRGLFDRPDTQRILSRAIPVKQLDAPPKAVDWVTDPLPIPIRSRANPNGVPLGPVSAMVKERVPGVASVVVRDNSVLVTWSKPPTPEMRKNLSAVLTDQNAFQKIQQLSTPPPLVDPGVVAKLLAPTTPDDEWLRSFRQLQVASLRVTGVPVVTPVHPIPIVPGPLGPGPGPVGPGPGPVGPGPGPVGPGPGPVGPGPGPGPGPT